MSKIYVKDKREALLEKINLYLKKHKGIRNWAIGYLTATLVDALNSLSSTDFLDVLKNKFYISTKISNVGIYIAISLIGIYYVMQLILNNYFKDKTEDRRLKGIYEEYTDKIFEDHATEGISWGLGQTVTSAPDMRKGWETKEIKFEVDTSLYNIQMLKNLEPSFRDRDFQCEYESYIKYEFPKHFTTDSDRLMLQNKPVSMTDDYALCIKLKRVKWSQLQYLWNKVLTDNIRRTCIDRLFYDKVIFHPNSFCLHLVVKTSDGKILLTENSMNKENDYAKSWAVSIGEQIGMEDIKDLDADCAYEWVKRALHEELSVNEDEFNKGGIHFLSINLEGDIVNFAIVCVVEIILNSASLVDRMHTELRIDNEFKHIDFITIDDLPKELIMKSREYHPSSQIRMLYTYLNAKGGSELRLQLLKNKYKLEK